jgi:hypothetical protein
MSLTCIVVKNYYLHIEDTRPSSPETESRRDQSTKVPLKSEGDNERDAKVAATTDS